MTVPTFALTERQEPFARAALIIARAAGELLLHGLRHPFRPAALCRRTGKVRAR